MTISAQPHDSGSKITRKPVPRRVRFEVFRRDNYTCRYCRATDGELTIDHVKPQVLGGSNDPSNLVACCKDCNAGKTSSTPDATLVAQVSEDALRWAAAMKMASQGRAEDAAKADERTSAFGEFWHACVDGAPVWVACRYRLPWNWKQIAAGYLDAGMPMEALIDAAAIALTKEPEPIDGFRYFQGVANNILGDLQDAAYRLLEDGAV